MPSVDWGFVTALAALVTALGGAIAGFVKGRHDGASIAQTAVREAQEFWSVTLERQNNELDRLRARVGVLEERDARITEMEGHLESVYSWIERGKRPPTPQRPPWLKPGSFSPLALNQQPTTHNPKE